MRRLACDLPNIPARCAVRNTIARALQIGMAHIGVGAFHRCHQAEYSRRLAGGSFRPLGYGRDQSLSASARRPLVPQDCLYSRTLRDGERAETRVIGSIKRAIDVQDAESAEAAVAALAAPAIQVVTMTVTEKGYCLIPATGALDRGNPALEADLGGAFPPRTLLGLLTRALEQRRARRRRQLTLVSCDNIPSNGDRLRNALLAFVERRSPDSRLGSRAASLFPQPWWTASRPR